VDRKKRAPTDAGRYELRRKIMRFIVLSFTLLFFFAACATTQQPSGGASLSDTSTVSIFQNQQIFVEATVQNNGSVTLMKVSKVANPNTTLTFNFEKADGGMMLSVENPLNVSLKYHIDLVDNKGKLHKTSSCPVMAGIRALESWPYLISEIRITNAHVISIRENEEILCVY
jgi:hypothetical protein